MFSKIFILKMMTLARQGMLLQTLGSLQQLETLVNDKCHEKLKFELP